MFKLVILDRDGVINHDSDDYIKSPEEWCAIEGSLKAIAALNHAGILVAIATNQSGVGRGLFTESTLHAIHDTLEQALALEGGHIDTWAFCPHTPDDHCNCRKPHPGLLLTIAERLNVPLNEACFIGDNVKDITAAKLAGCAPVLVKTGKGERMLASHAEQLQGVPVFADLATAVDQLIFNK